MSPLTILLGGVVYIALLITLFCLFSIDPDENR